MSAARTAKRPPGASAKPIDAEVERVVALLRRKGSKANRDSLARFAIPSERAFGVSMKDVQALAKQIGRNHALALALWETGWHEVRALCAYVDDPASVTPAQMDRWCRDFDNWAVCDTLCFALFDRTPHAFRAIDRWAKRKPEFERRAAFALLASLALHDRESPDAPFLARLPLVEAASADERNFVRKGVVWALRLVGERSVPLNDAAAALAKRLADSEDKTARATGKEVLRELAKPAAKKRLAMRARR
jgi:3-methyladenine DNA glycosylase AlkD